MHMHPFYFALFTRFFKKKPPFPYYLNNFYKFRGILEL